MCCSVTGGNWSVSRRVSSCAAASGVRGPTNGGDGGVVSG